MDMGSTSLLRNSSNLALGKGNTFPEHQRHRKKEWSNPKRNGFPKEAFSFEVSGTGKSGVFVSIPRYANRKLRRIFG